MENPYLTTTDDMSLPVDSIPVFIGTVNSPKVTIAIPTFNRPTTIKRAIDSALNQVGFGDYDVIVVDNNPVRDDDTEKLLKTYTSPRLSYYKNSENLGIVGNHNKLFQLAKGEYVVLLHDDDYLYPNFLWQVFVKFSKILAESDILHPFHFTDAMQGAIFNKTYVRLHLGDFLLGDFISAPVGLTLKKSVFFELGEFSKDFGNAFDYEFYIRALKRNKKLYKIYGEPICHYTTEDNTSSSFNVISELIEDEDKIYKTYQHRIFGLRRWLRDRCSESLYAHMVKILIFQGNIKDPTFDNMLALQQSKETKLSKACFRYLMLLNRILLKLRKKSYE